jgi:hypothetical protein
MKTLRTVAIRTLSAAPGRPTAALLAAMALICFWPATAPAGPDYTKVVGPTACSECHKAEAAVWQNTHHFSTFRELPRKKEAREISAKMGLKRIKSGSLCLDCHFTSQDAGGKPKTISGISCESCHGAGKDYIKVHSTFSGKKKEQETKEEAAKRWAAAEAGGMIRPHNIYAWAKNCYSCHVVPQEKLVNEGGHKAGSAFELVAWSQGEIRHNNWYTGGKENRQATLEEKRKMYVIGTAVELEIALRAVGKSTAKAKYAVSMAKRAAAAKKVMAKVAGALKLPELDAIVAAQKAARLRLNNEPELAAAADKIGAAIQEFAKKYDGSKLAAIDPLLPGEDKYKGKPSQ